MREKLMECVQMAHNAVSFASFDATLTGKPFSYADEMATITDSLITNGVTIPVRCKDCKNNGQCNIQDAMNWTPRAEIGDYFCSYGERINKDERT